MMLVRTLLLFIAVAVAGTSGYVISQECDWTGSGLSGGEKRGVRPVYLRCGAGRVRWTYPSGALRVLLRLGSGSDREFRACLRPTSESSLPASIHLEGLSSLNTLYSPTAEPLKRPQVRCVQSRGGQVALYVEAVSESHLQRQVVEFAYDLQPIAKGSVYDPTEECRPCSKEEMIHAFCTSELVTRGIIQRVEPIEDSDVSEITVKVTKTLRRWRASWGENDVLNDDDEEDETDDDGDDHPPPKEVIQVGRHCGAQHGAGEMIIMARRKLGQLVLSCAPRLTEWSELIKETAVRDSAHCLLSS